MDIDIEKVLLSDNNIKFLEETLSKLQEHYPNGPRYANFEKYKAVKYFNQKEQLKAIYHFSESHFPSLRVKSCYRYDRAADDEDTDTLNKKSLEFNCNSENCVNSMLSKIEEMPEEWTIVQITAFNSNYNQAPFSKVKDITPILYITAFECGVPGSDPICVQIDPPTLNDERLEIVKMIREQILAFSNFTGIEERNSINKKLRELTDDMENTWLKEWRILLLGKLIKANKLVLQLENIVQQALNGDEITEKQNKLLLRFGLACTYLNRREIMKVILSIIDDQQLSFRLARAFGDFAQANKLDMSGTRHPVILLIDQHVDNLPWEACEILKQHPVSRLPSIRFTYALFKEYKSQIVDGLITKTNSSNGAYVVNPSDNLEKMEKRLRLFYDYWLPNWRGIIGTETDSEQFKNLLTTSDVFVYSGHGSGIQYLQGEDIQKLRVRAVVMLFGCESVKLDNKGGYDELWSTFYYYLIACSPCVVGNLWKVTSTDLDYITTKLLSTCVPSEATHWKLVDKRLWDLKSRIVVKESKVPDNQSLYEPDLLRAVCLARKSANEFLNAASLIVRGLPVKM